MSHKHNNSDSHVIYYATELMNGDRWYNYAMIDFITDNGDTKCCPAKILGFIRYKKTLGIPTPQFIQDECLTIEEIKWNNFSDNSLYIVVHVASDYLTLDRLQDDFASKFTLGYVRSKGWMYSWSVVCFSKLLRNRHWHQNIVLYFTKKRLGDIFQFAH